MSQRLNGRVGRRLRIVSAGRLSEAEDLAASRKLICNRNHKISVHGIRVVSNHPRQIGERPQIAISEERPSMQGEAVHWQSRRNRFWVGFKFQEPVRWSPPDSVSHELKQRLGES